jgi:hypothetical protein
LYNSTDVNDTKQQLNHLKKSLDEIRKGREANVEGLKTSFVKAIASIKGFRQETAFLKQTKVLRTTADTTSADKPIGLKTLRYQVKKEKEINIDVTNNTVLFHKGILHH